MIRLKFWKTSLPGRRMNWRTGMEAQRLISRRGDWLRVGGKREREEFGMLPNFLCKGCLENKEEGYLEVGVPRSLTRPRWREQQCSAGSLLWGGSQETCPVVPGRLSYFS